MSADIPAPPAAEPALSAAQLARLGIIRIATEQYQVGPYRYGKLSDAIAQAKRPPKAENDQ